MSSYDRQPHLLAEIDATALLQSRPRRTPDWRQEAEALASLAEVFAEAPEKLAQALVEAAVSMTGAQAAGISIDEVHSVPRVFRWVATAGTYSRYINGTMPWDFSPCGEVVRRDAPILMREMQKLYAYVKELNEPPHEVLLVPFRHRGAPVGTVWVVSHDERKHFDSEDLRIVQTLTRFAAAGVETAGLVKHLSAANAAQADELADHAKRDASKDRFMALLAHEMRTPLSAISLNAQLIKRVGGDAGRRDAAVAILERQTRFMTALIRDMTDVVAIREGKLSLSMAAIAIQDVVAGALDACGDQMRSKGQQLHLHIPEEAVVVEGDIVRLTQVVVNLVNNAIKYTPEHGRIEIDVVRGEHSLALSVSDSGIGIDSSQISGIFDMYMQVQVDDRPVDSGLGIGLWLVKQIVRLHRGDVSAASEGLGKGSTFTVTLPIRHARL
ncbi:GAF domain-containing sensor histidine kinase [Lysobacter arenosi]|jgi:signal transduction histidine kinase|uniref:histidine kinase n=1 Tax=Lysobacter arenosi TaxID=2795387 RepID=A0ABX7R8T5_9GAMM|nr:GAF domain-containing sensor histidine kinase [Lysobacter arenosi]QSX73831.1 GAF domain-containing sensor histidine kinase [Lysobacter arenosi]